MKEWIELQRRLQRRAQQELKSVASPQRELQRYAKAYQQDFRQMKVIDQNRFFRRIQNPDYLFFGDFHSLSQSQKFLLRLLRHPQVQKPAYLALEALRPKDEKLALAYLKSPSRRTEERLRDALPLEAWGASWPAYKSLFEECSKHQIQIIGLGFDDKKLEKRDELAAKRLCLLKKKAWILFGEFHCAKKHIPRLLQLKLSGKEVGVIQQNEDKLLNKHLEEFSRRRPIFLESQARSRIPFFCVLHTPSWVKWQSYLDHQVHREEDESPIDAQEQIRWSVRSLIEFLDDVRYPKPFLIDDLLDFSVIESEDEDFSSLLRELSVVKQKRVIRSMEATRVAALASDRRIFITEKTLNACAQAAALYIYQAWSRQSEPYANFYQSVLTECLCFFMTKILNHSRRTRHWKELRKLKSPSAQLALRSKDFIHFFSHPKSFVHSNNKELIHAGIWIGRILADRLFEAFLAGEFSKQRLNRLLLQPPKNKTEVFERVVELQSVGRAFEPSSTL